MLHAKSHQSFPTLCNPMDYSPPGSSIHEILQARKMEWVACPPPGDLSDPGIKPVPLMSLALADGFFNTCTTLSLNIVSNFFFLSLEPV